MLLENFKLRLKNEYSCDDDFVNMYINEYDRFIKLRKLFQEKNLIMNVYIPIFKNYDQFIL